MQSATITLMHYVTATLGAILIFAAVLVVSLVANAFLPAALRAPLTINLGSVQFWITPMLLVGLGVGLLAAIHSFRSTLKRRQQATGTDAGAAEDSK